MQKRGKISFRAAKQADRDFLLQLRKQSMQQHLLNAGIVLNDQQHYARVDEHFSDSRLILLDEHAIGVLKLGIFAYNVHIRQFQLLPAYHGQGIGSMVLTQLKKQAFDNKKSISLNVLKQNPAKQLYLRHGFVVIEENDVEFKMRWQSH